MISRLLTLGEPLFMDFDIQIPFKKHKEMYGNIFENSIAIHLKIPKKNMFWNVGTDLEKTGAEK